MVTASAGTHSRAREESRWVAAVAPVGGPFSRFGTGWERGGGAGVRAQARHSQPAPPTSLFT